MSTRTQQTITATLTISPADLRIMFADASTDQINAKLAHDAAMLQTRLQLQLRQEIGDNYTLSFIPRHT